MLNDNTPTPHNTAKMGDFADTVLMPGDPIRVKYIVDKFFDNATLVNNVRGVNGYTGTCKGKNLSIMASGMGQPSMGIYSYELYNFYDVKNIIRIGSAGTIKEDLEVGSIVFAMGACTDSNYVSNFNLPGHFSSIADYELLSKAVECAKKLNYKYEVGNIITSDMFYQDDKNDTLKWGKMNVLCVEMETAALYMNAARANKKALSILTISDNLYNQKNNLTAEERVSSFDKMIDIALNII